MQIDERLEGMRAIGQIRSSRKSQAWKSIPQQRQWLKEFAASQKMTYVDDMEEAVSASQIIKRPDIERIFTRKKLLNDFDTILIQDPSRLTRGGRSHGLEIFFRLKAAGIKLVSITDGYIDCDDKIDQLSAKFAESKAQAKITAMVGRRGVMNAKEQKRMAYSLAMPYGVDRLITDLAGNARCRIRRLDKHTTQKLSPDGTILLQAFSRDVDGNPTRYQKQHDEIEECVPGAPEEVAMINAIYKGYYIEGKSPWMLTRDINSSGFVTRCGGQFNTGVVVRILKNPIYLGEGYGNLVSKALFWMNGTNGSPIEVLPEHRGQMIYRGEEHWLVTKYAALNNFLNLDDATKEQISRIQLEEMRRLASGVKKKRGGNRHKDSSYFLQGILRDNEYKTAFRGHSIDRGSRRWRYYKNPRQSYAPNSNVSTRMINADVIEPAMKSALFACLQNYEGLSEAVRLAVQEHESAIHSEADKRTSLANEKSKLLEEISYWVSQMRILGREFVNSKVTPLTSKVSQIDEETLVMGNMVVEVSAEKQAEQMVAALTTVKEEWDNLSPMQLNRVMRVLVKRMEVDMNSLHIEVDLRLPSWATFDGTGNELCLENGLQECRNYETYTTWQLDLGSVTSYL